jgi:hypothetical protein
MTKERRSSKINKTSYDGLSHRAQLPLADGEVELPIRFKG